MKAMHDNNGDHAVHTPAPAPAPARGHEQPHAQEDLSAAAPRTPAQRKRAGRRAWAMLGVIGVGAVAAAAASTMPRLAVPAQLAETTRRIENARRSVTVVSPAPAKTDAEVRLTGSKGGHVERNLRRCGLGLRQAGRSQS